MKAQGHQIFGDELARFAGGCDDARVTAIAVRMAAPLRVAVRGRSGAGCSTVARALGRAAASSGITVTEWAGAADPDADMQVDVEVYVFTEVIKPEDGRAVTGGVTARRPVLAVLNKADLTGFAGAGPIAAAQARCRDFATVAGVPVEPMIGLLAVAALDDMLDGELWAALRVLATYPGASVSLDGSFDGFLGANNPVPVEARLRLLDTLDLFGTALAVAAVQQRNTAAQVRALLRRVSCVDAVVGKVVALGAEARYRRVLDAVAELEAYAVSGASGVLADDSISERIGEFLSRDDTVIARMAAAVDLAEAQGLAAGLDFGPREGPRERLHEGPYDDPATHLPRAVRWQRYSLGRFGPVSDIHRACGADIARGSLRLWSQAGGSPPGGFGAAP